MCIRDRISAVAVEAAVNAVALVLFQLGGHDAHGGHGRTDQRQEVLDLVALLEIGDEAAVAGHALGGMDKKKIIIKKLTLLPCIPSVTYTYKF